MRHKLLLAALLIFISTSLAHAVVYSGAMDSRSGQTHIPGITAQSKAFKAGGNPGEGLRLEWQVDNVTTPGSWTYAYRLIRGTSKNKGFAFFDIETAGDFTTANILNRQVSWATNGNDNQILSGLVSVTISDPVNFNAIHDFSNAVVTEDKFSLVALSKSDLSHYSGDPGIEAPGVPGGEASDTPLIGPVPHPFYGIRITFPGTHLDLAYEASEWEFKITSDRAPMWGSFFGWGDQTQISPFWYANIYNRNIDNPVRLALPPASNLYGTAPYEGWILVPGPQVTAQPSRLSVDLATYNRSSSGDGYVNIFATALPNAVLTVSGNGIAGPVVMTADAPNPAVFGRFSAQIPFTQLPSSVVVSNSRDPVTVSPHPVPLVDEVTISLATYNPNTRVITIKAASSDRLLPLPALTAPDFSGPDTLDSTGTLLKTLTANPPSTVTVTSSKGGSATAQVTITTLSSFSVTSAAGPNGAISPAGATAVAGGGSQAYAITPDPGFTVAALVVDGVTLPGATSYTFTNVTADHYINAYFAPSPLHIISAAGPNGIISPAGATAVTPGSNQIYSITPNTGFMVAALSVDGVVLPAATSYTFTNVIADHAINAYFAPVPATVTITASAGPGGTISPAGANVVAGGSSPVFTVTPNSGLAIAALVVDGVVLPAATTFTFTNVSADHYINAYFQ